jgi:hypothetical protein
VKILLTEGVILPELSDNLSDVPDDILSDSDRGK